MEKNRVYVPMEIKKFIDRFVNTSGVEPMKKGDFIFEAIDTCLAKSKEVVMISMDKKIKEYIMENKDDFVNAVFYGCYCEGDIEEAEDDNSDETFKTYLIEKNTKLEKQQTCLQSLVVSQAEFIANFVGGTK